VLTDENAIAERLQLKKELKEKISLPSSSLSTTAPSERETN